MFARGQIYIFCARLPNGRRAYKIGITSRTAQERLDEIRQNGRTHNDSQQQARLCWYFSLPLHREGCADKGRLGWLISEAYASLHKAKYAETPPVHLSLSVAFMETRKTPSTAYYRYKAKSELVQMWAGSELIATEFSGIIKAQTVFNADGSPFVEITEAKSAATPNGQPLTDLELRDTDGSLYEPQRLIDEVLERAKRMFI